MTRKRLCGSCARTILDHAGLYTITERYSRRTTSDLTCPHSLVQHMYDKDILVLLLPMPHVLVDHSSLGVSVKSACLAKNLSALPSLAPC